VLWSANQSKGIRGEGVEGSGWKEEDGGKGRRGRGTEGRGREERREEKRGRKGILLSLKILKIDPGIMYSVDPVPSLTKQMICNQTIIYNTFEHNR